jgi:hypothetical protein
MRIGKGWTILIGIVAGGALGFVFVYALAEGPCEPECRGFVIQRIPFGFIGTVFGGAIGGRIASNLILRRTSSKKQSLWPWLVLPVIVLVLGLPLAIFLTDRNGGSMEISREDLGSSWPLTVQSGVLDCRFFGDMNVTWVRLTFTANDVTYALISPPNLATPPGFHEGRDIREIQIPGKPLDDLIHRGRQLC